MIPESEAAAAESVPDHQMQRILEDMIEKDEDITARAVARRHPSIRHASSITRIAARRELLAAYQSRQADLRAWEQRKHKTSGEKLTIALTDKDQKIAELKLQIRSLQVAVVAMLRVVGEMGGTRRFLEFYKDYREIRERMAQLGVLPQANVQEIGGASANAESNT